MSFLDFLNEFSQIFTDSSLEIWLKNHLETR